MDTDVSSIKYQVSSSLRKIVKELTGLEIEPEITVNSDLSKGDYSTNIAMATFGNVKSQMPNVKSPMEFAEKIVEYLKLDIGNLKFLDRVEVKAPGFINFWLSQAQVIKQIERVLDFDKIQNDKSRELILEFGDPNPFKEPHIGHLRIFSVGDSIARLHEAQGVKVIRASYQGDVGMHVAKALWGIIKLEIDILNTGSPEESAAFLSKAYATGSQAFETNESVKTEIIEINKKIYLGDPKIMNLWKKGRKISLDHFEQLYKKLGIKYDKYYFESETAALGKKIVEENIGKAFEKDDGTIVFRGENYGLHTRVFVTKEGHATYEGKDLALAFLKNKDFPETEKSIIITANEQIEYFKVMLSALQIIDARIAEKTSHLALGFVNLKEGKMSSRTGNVVSAFWLIGEIKKRLKKDFKEVSDSVLEDLSVGSVKWAMLKFSRESNISFSIEESIAIVGNSGPYMQYTHARISSLLSKSSKGDFEANSVKSLDPELLALARTICQFKFRVKSAAENFSPNILTEYLFDLAQKFNGFYEKEKIIGSNGEEEKLIVVKAVGEVLKKGLYLLGIASPNKI